jgi:hypothetical protein
LKLTAVAVADTSAQAPPTTGKVLGVVKGMAPPDGPGCRVSTRRQGVTVK